MIPKDILRKIRRIQITTSHLALDVFSGKYQSVFKGKGMEFYEVRQYLPGDEIRSIDWNVTARTGHPYVKKFIEERELTLMILLDVSMSCLFGSKKTLKNQIAAEISSLFAFSAIQNNDKVGLIIFTDRIEKYIPPKKGLRHVLRVIREALCFKPAGRGTDINKALQYLSRVSKRKSIAFVISDFVCGDFKRMLAVTNKRHDVVAVTINDPVEMEFPDMGIVRLYDAETDREVTLDTGDSLFRRKYFEDAGERTRKIQKIFRSVNVDSINVYTDKPYINELIRFFKERQRRLR